MAQHKRLFRAQIASLVATSCLLVACRPLNVASDGGQDLSGPADPDGPLVEVIAPISALDPARDPVIVDAVVEVICRATAAEESRPVNPASVQAFVYEGDKTTPSLTAQANANGDGSYAASVAVDALMDKSLRFECSAQDTAGRIGKGEIRTLRDPGPSISVASPLDGAALSRRGDALVLFSVTPAPLGGNDPGAAVSSVKLLINGSEVTPQRLETGSYSYTLDFGDLDRFPPSVDEITVEVHAQNQRAPKAASRVVKTSAIVDGAGPEITLRTPMEMSLVGQKAEVVADVNDALSGLKEGSVRTNVSIEDLVDVFPMSATPEAPSTFRANFQTTAYKNRAQLTINVVAEDKAGNETRLARVVSVDNVPPWLSLDPPPARLALQQSGSAPQCSAPFDPVGSDAINDLTTNEGLFAVYRALVWERGVIADEDQIITRLSGVDETTVAMFVQGRPQIPLIVDSDADGVCDSINVDPEPVGAENDPVKVPLKQVNSVGTPFPGSTAPDDAAPSIVGQCSASTGTAPARVCADTEMTYVTQHTTPALGSVVYALDPTGSGVGCTGVDWQATVDGGYACVAATAKDKSGNVGISLPLRICYDSPRGSGKCLNAGAPPSCTDGCVMPDVFKQRGFPNLILRAQ